MLRNHKVSKYLYLLYLIPNEIISELKSRRIMGILGLSKLVADCASHAIKEYISHWIEYL